MSNRPQFDSAYIEAEFERIAASLRSPLTIYCIGGGAMALRGLKETTKDIDVIVDSSEAHGRLWRALLEAGYTEIESLADEYEQLGASSCVENDDGCRIDIFDRQVVDKLVLTDGMKTRGEPFTTAGKLTVELVSLEDIFLFKAVAKREDDIDDMNLLVQSGLDFEAIEQALGTQIETLGHPLFATYVAEALETLEDRYGVTLPIEQVVIEYAEPYYDALEIYFAIDEPIPIEQLTAELGFASDDLEDRLSTLEALDKIAIADGVVYPQEEGDD